MPLRGFPVCLGQSELKDSAIQEHDLGMPAIDNLGRRFRYARAGAVTLVAGNVLQSPAWDTQQAALAVPAAYAIGANSVTVTNGTTAVVAGEYAGGVLVTEVTPGEGYTYPIIGNSAAISGAAITVTLAYGLVVAWTTATKVSLHYNEYNGVIQAPVTTLTGIPVGVAVYPITATYYGWIGTGGTHGTFIKTTPALGQALAGVAGTAGEAAINSGTTAIIGNIRVTGVDGKVKPVYWTLD